MSRKLLIFLLATLLLVPSAWAADVGIFQTKTAQTCAQRIASPATGQSWCFDLDANALKLWNGTAWVSVVGAQALPAYALASLPAAGTAGRLARVTDTQGGIYLDTGSQWLSIRGVVDVAFLATGGVGSSASPWTGWDTAITWTAYTAYFFRPGGYYKTVAGITVNQDGVYLIGGGKRATFIEFAPTGAGTAVKFSKGATELFLGGISGIRFRSTDTTYAKVALELSDVSDFQVSDLHLGDPSWTGGSGAGSIGLQLKGRELISVRGVTIQADSPINVLANPNSSISLDQAHFQDLYLLGTGMTNPLITIATGLDLTNVSFDGYQAWVKGGFGLQWVDTTSTAVSTNLSFKNVRWEQSTNATGYMFDIQRNATLQNVRLENIYTGSGANYRGFKFRNTNHLTIANTYYAGTGEALNVDSSVRPMILDNVFFQTGSTLSIGTLRQIFSFSSAAGGTVNPYAVYDTIAAGSGQFVMDLPVSGNTVSIAQDATATIGTNALKGFLHVNTDENTGAIYYLRGTTNTTAEVSDPDGFFSVTAASAGQYNIYHSGGNYLIENKRTGTHSVRWLLIGAPGF